MDKSKVAQGVRLAQWTQIIQNRMAEGASINEYCAEKGISRNAYFYWLRRVREAACDHIAAQQGGLALHSNGCSFAEVRVEQARAYVETNTADQINLEYDGVSVSIGSNYPPEKLAVVIRELARR